jgi:hypothetical protein
MVQHHYNGKNGLIFVLMELSMHIQKYNYKEQHFPSKLWGFFEIMKFKLDDIKILVLIHYVMIMLMVIIF